MSFPAPDTLLPVAFAAEHGFSYFTELVELDLETKTMLWCSGLEDAKSSCILNFTYKNLSRQINQINSFLPIERPQGHRSRWCCEPRDS